MQITQRLTDLAFFVGFTTIAVSAPNPSEMASFSGVEVVRVCPNLALGHPMLERVLQDYKRSGTKTFSESVLINGDEWGVKVEPATLLFRPEPGSPDSLSRDKYFTCRYEYYSNGLHIKIEFDAPDKIRKVAADMKVAKQEKKAKKAQDAAQAEKKKKIASLQSDIYNLRYKYIGLDKDDFSQALEGAFK